MNKKLCCLTLTLLSTSALQGFQVEVINLSDLQMLQQVAPTKTKKLFEILPVIAGYNQTIPIFPLRGSKDLPQATPIPSPPASGNYEDTVFIQNTGLISIIDPDATPMSLSLQSGTSHHTSLQAPSTIIEGSAISISDLQQKYSFIHLIIQQIEAQYQLLTNAYNTDSGVYTVSHSVLTALNNFLQGHYSPNDRPYSSNVLLAFRRLFSTLNINLLWRITDTNLLTSIFTQYFDNPQHVESLLSPLEAFLDSLESRRVINNNTSIALHAHCLNIISQQFNTPGVQALLQQQMYNAALLSILLTDKQVQRSIDFSRDTLRNFPIRRQQYPELFSALTSHLMTIGLSSGNADAFYDNLLQLIRRGCQHLLALDNAVDDIQLDPTEHFLRTLNHSINTGTVPFEVVLRVLTTPMLLQTAVIFVNYTNSFNASATNPLLTAFFSQPATSQASPFSTELDTAITALNALAIAAPTPDGHQMTTGSDILAILTALGISQEALVPAAQHLTIMINRHDTELLRDCSDRASKKLKIQQFLTDLVKRKLQL